MSIRDKIFGTKKITDEDIQEELKKEIQEYINLHDEAIGEFDTKWEEMRRNEKIHCNDHYDENTKAELESEDRVAYAMPMIENKTLYLLAQHAMHRLGWRTVGRGSEDEIDAEIVSHIVDYIQENNDFEFIEGEVFFGGVAIRWDCVVIERDYTENPLGETVLRRVPYDQCMWDTNCKEYDKSKFASWTEDFEYYTKEELIAMFPEVDEEIIDNISPESCVTTSEDKKKLWFKTDKKKEFVKLVCHSQRKYKKVWQWYDKEGNPYLSDEPVKVDNKKVFKVIPKGRKYTEVFYFTGDGTVLSSYIQKNIRHKHYFYFALGRDNNYLSLTDLLISPVRLLDMIVLQIEFGLRKLIKGGNYEVDYERVHPKDKENWPNIAKGLTKGGQVLRKIGSAPVLTAVDKGSINPELFSMFEIITRFIDELTGGKPSTGTPNSPTQSGVAIQLLQQVGFMIAYIFLNNLRRFKKALGEGLIFEAQDLYGSPNRSIRILGKNLSQEISAILQKEGRLTQGNLHKDVQWMNSTNEIKKSKVDLVMTDTPAVAMYADTVTAMLMEYNKAAVQGGTMPLPPELVMGKSKAVDATIKDMLSQWYQKQEEFKQAAIEEEKRANNLKAKTEMLKISKDLMVAENQNSLQKESNKNGDTGKSNKKD